MPRLSKNRTKQIKQRLTKLYADGFSRNALVDVAIRNALQRQEAVRFVEGICGVKPKMRRVSFVSGGGVSPR